MRITIPKLLGLSFGVILGGYVFVVAPHLPGKILTSTAQGPARALTVHSDSLFPLP